MNKRLGRGLADLIQTPTTASAVQTPAAMESGTSYVLLRTDQIAAGRYQPRTVMSEPGLEELKASIKRQGVIEPVIVRPLAHGTYELVAGERRWRAAQAVGLAQVPALIKALSDKEALEYSLIENIQRENLNPLEEARGYQRLIDEFGYTQEAVAEAVGKERATVANLLRLLRLPEEIQRGLEKNEITLGHAKVLLSVENRQKQIDLFAHVAKEKLSVRQLEWLAQPQGPTRERRSRNTDEKTDVQTKAIEKSLREALGTKVALNARGTRGKIVIDYFSQEDLSRICAILGISV